jgi:hypothetical protein
VLAGEPFSDHPRSVCPVIGSLLRSYNDAIDDARRQTLIEYAPAIVGTRAATGVQEQRTAKVLAWTAARRRRRWALLLPAPLRRIGALATRDSVGSEAVRALRRHSDSTHEQVLELVRDLIATSAEAPVCEEPFLPDGSGVRAQPEQHAAVPSLIAG